MALNNCLPFNTLKTHGLILDSKGEKMSKSMKNFIDPEDIIEGSIKQSGERKYGFGAEVFRLWAAKNDSDIDLTIKEEDLQETANELKDIRNLFWILLGHLNQYIPENRFDDLTLIDKLMMLKIYDFNLKV